MAERKTMVVVGWVLVALLPAMYFAVMLLATFSGDGATPVKLILGGRGGSHFPVAALPILVALVVVGFFWLRRILRGRAFRGPPNFAFEADAMTHWTASQRPGARCFAAADCER